MNLSRNLKKIRKDNNLSQEQLAEQLGVSRQSVSKWENGEAYPEMDKMIQLCQLFNLNIDDLLNQDITELNNAKQSKININKFIDDFLDYITKTIDVFCAMNFNNKVKCLFEQFVLIVFVLIILLVIGTIGSNILSNLLSFLPRKVYYPIYNIFEAIYIIAGFILEIILVLHIFKTRYLNYYDLSNNDKVKEVKKIEKIEKVEKEDKDPKIIIRDPEHSGYKFISGLVKCLLLFIKVMALCISLVLCVSFIGLIFCLVISFAFIKTGLLFLGILFILLSFVIINLLVLIVFYNFIISRKTKWNRMFSILIISLILLGSGIGFTTFGITDFDLVRNDNYIQTEYNIEMNDKLFFINYYEDINYVESDNKNIKIVYNHSNFYKLENYTHGNGHHLYFDLDDNIMQLVRTLIKDINNKKIVNYFDGEIYIYTTKENIEILKSNLDNYFNNEDEIIRQQMINGYERKINELRIELEIKNNEIDRLLNEFERTN